MNLLKQESTAVLARRLATVITLLSTAVQAEPLPDPLQAGWKGQAVCEKLHENDRQRILRCSFPPGTGHERHFHAPNFGYALSGGRVRMTDTTGTRELDLPTDSSFYSEGTDWHEVMNIGDTTVIYLIVENR